MRSGIEDIIFKEIWSADYHSERDALDAAGKLADEIMALIGWHDSDREPPPMGKYLLVKQPGGIPFVASVSVDDSNYWSEVENPVFGCEVALSKWMYIPE